MYLFYNLPSLQIILKMSHMMKGCSSCRIMWQFQIPKKGILAKAGGETALYRNKQDTYQNAFQFPPPPPYQLFSAQVLNMGLIKLCKFALGSCCSAQHFMLWCHINAVIHRNQSSLYAGSMAFLPCCRATGAFPGIALQCWAASVGLSTCSQCQRPPTTMNVVYLPPAFPFAYFCTCHPSCEMKA